MSPTSDQSKIDRKQYAFNLSLAAVAGQVGCLTLAIVLTALFVGLWLDNRYASSNHMYTIGLMVGSVPFTLAAMFWVVRRATAHIRPSSRQDSVQILEEENSGKTS